MRRMMRYISAALVFLLTFLGPLSVSALAENDTRQTVRVGFFPFEGYHMVDEYGERSGYGYEYIQNMLNFADWKYEYIGYEENASWSDMLTMLQNGEIDMLTSAVKTPEREELFDFSDEPIGTSSTIITVKSGNTKYAAGKPGDWSGIKVGLLKGSSRNDSFASYAEENGFSYSKEYFDTNKELTENLQKGTIDAIVTSNLRNIEDEWLIAQFDAKPFYVIVKKGNKKLLDEVNFAVSQVNSTQPDLVSSLFRKYYSPTSGDQIAYDAQERAFIERCEREGTVFTAIIDPDRKPYSYYEDGEMKGSLVDICREIFRRTGLSIEILPLTSRSEYIEKRGDSSAAICCDCNDILSTAEDMGYIVAGTYYESTISRLYRKDFNGTVSTAAVVGGSTVASLLQDSAESGVELRYYDSIEACADAVKKGEVDTCYLLTSAAQSVIYADETNRLICVTLPEKTRKFTIGVNDGESYLLSSIVDKALRSVSETDIMTITAPYLTNESKPQTLLGLFYDQPLVMAGAIALLLVLLFMLYGLAALRRRQVAEEKSNAILKEAVENAGRANQAKSRFLSQMSHEIRTPMNAIVGITTIAKQHEREPEKIDEYLGKIESASKVLLNIINDVLDMSAIEGGKMKIASAEFDLKAILNGISNIYYAQCRQKNLRFTMATNISDEVLMGDSLRVNQILLNLVSNAYKFTEPGGEVRVFVSETGRKNNTAYMEFVVEDTGIGMSDEMVERIFRPFEQESATTARKYGGSGLGLSITKNLVSMMHGSIDVKTEKGKGTRFTVELPFECAEESVQCVKMGELRALVVDDESSARDYTGMLLARIGVGYDIAESGQRALDMMNMMSDKGTPYDVCFIDWKMPGMNGVETTRRIREKFGKGTLIIIVSAYDLTEVSDEAREAGADVFVAKPLFQSTVFNVLMSLNKNRREKAEKTDEKYDFTGRRVLIAEDNELNREVAKGLLDMVNMQEDFAVNGAKAVELFTNSPAGTYDAILMDVQMPVLNGHDAARAIRASDHPQARSITIYAMTADAFTDDISAALACGMNGHIAKPVNAEELYKKLREAIDGESAAK